MSDDHSQDVDLFDTRATSSGSVQFMAAAQTTPDPSTCVICLEDISEKAVTLPCEHANFDFACLGAWLQRRSTCPLCKTVVSGIKYDLDALEGPQIFSLPLPQLDTAPSQRVSRSYDTPRGRQAWYGYRVPRNQQDQAQDEALGRRREVYRHRTYSLHVGSNRISRYRTLTPRLFLQDESLLHRARIWARRELQVFEFLSSDATQPQAENIIRRARNSQFLLEYIVAILRSIDIRGSTGQAEELLQEFLGRENARLFLHELENWLRSPYERLQEWDEAVQYEHMSARDKSQKMQSRAASMS